LDVVGSRAVVIDDIGRPEGLLRESPTMAGDLVDFLQSNAFTHPTVMGRTRWFADHPYDEKISRAEDKDLWLRTFSSSRFDKVQDPLLFYRVSRAFDRGKSRRTMIDDARVLLRNERARASLRATLPVVGKSLLKAGIYATMPAASWPRLRAKRIETAAEGMTHAWEQELERIRKVQVPGWD